MGEVRIAKDFLPSPDQLVLKEVNVPIAISRRNLGHICQRAGKVQQVKEKSKTPSELLTNPETSVKNGCFSIKCKSKENDDPKQELVADLVALGVLRACDIPEYDTLYAIANEGYGKWRSDARNIETAVDEVFEWR
jgi:hypothetical protein